MKNFKTIYFSKKNFYKHLKHFNSNGKNLLILQQNTLEIMVAKNCRGKSQYFT